MDEDTLQIVGMVQLQPLPGSAQYTGEPLTEIVDAALAEARVLADAGFTGVQLQNMGDNPSSRRAGLETIAFMTAACREVRRDLPGLQLSVLVNWDAEASIAVAAATDADFVRVEHTWVGAAVTSWGLSTAQCHQATSFRTRIRSTVPIYADVLEPHAVPLVHRPVEEWAQAAVVEGRADGLFITGASVAESLDWIRRIRAVLPASVPLWLGGGASVDNVSDIVGLVDGVTVATSLKHGDMSNPLDPILASQFAASYRHAHHRFVAEDPRT
jgi:membrane complex biogenesis BtpA family protein